MPISRRTLLAAGAATTLGIGTAGVLAVRSQGAGAPATPKVTATSSPAVARTPSPGATATATPIPRGGSVRRTSPYAFSFDTFDAQRSGEVSVLEVLARTHSRLLSWSEFPASGEPGKIAGDLVSRWEQPAATLLLLHINPKARWQASDREPRDAVRAEEVAIHLQRGIALARAATLPSVQRPWDYASLARVEAQDDSTVALELDRPDPFVFDTLAARFALVQSPQTVEEFEGAWHELSPESVRGSGPWVLDSHDGGCLAFHANRHSHRAPHLDSLEVFAPVRRVSGDALAERDEWLLRDRRDLPALRPSLAGAWTESTVLADSPIISTFDVGAAPWNDPRMIRALDYALNRVFLTQAIFGGRATGSSVIPAQFGVEPAPGAPGFGSSDEDAKEARLLWTAASGESAGPLQIDLPSIFDPVHSAGETIAARLREVLGAEVRLSGESYRVIARKSADHYYGNGRAATWFGWGPPIAEPSLGRWLSETFASTSATARSNNFASAEVDAAIQVLPAKSDAEGRGEHIRQLAESLAVDRSGGVITWVTQRFERLRSSAISWESDTPFASQHFDSTLHLR